MWVAEIADPSGCSDKGSTSPFAASACDASKAPCAAARENAGGKSIGVFQLVELILKDRSALERRIREQSSQTAFMSRLLMISVASFTLYAFAMVTMLQAAAVWPQLTPMKSLLAGDTTILMEFKSMPHMAAVWFDGSAFNLGMAYVVGLIAATGICLPSLYFYGLLAGIRMSMLDVVLHALKSKATASVALVGLLPIYAAIAMAVIVFGVTGQVRDVTLFGGLLLPFVGGFWGTWSLYRGFLGLSDTMCGDRRFERECFLRRLVVSWSFCYTAVSPLMIYTLWEFMERI